MNGFLAKDYIVVGLNHKTAPLALREALAFSPKALADSLRRLRGVPSVDEGFILSTCNRVEIYSATHDSDHAIASIRNFLSESKRLSPEVLNPHLYSFRSGEVVRHLFRVASSLDSMVVGETQITQQVKKAYEQSLAVGASEAYVNRLVNRALYVAKKVRTETEVSRHPVSVGQSAVHLAGKIFDRLGEKKICLVGAGLIGGLVLQSLSQRGVLNVTLVNRSLGRAEKLAAGTNVVVQPLARLEEALLAADIALFSVQTSTPLLSSETITRLMKKRKNQPLLAIDLGLPRNIDPEAAKIGNVYLYNLDDLATATETNKDLRKQEAVKAEEIVAFEAILFYERLNNNVHLQKMGARG
ncbi:MAG: glutamyl-tRNA reductase [Deltaproteobacteria bacterium]|nr:glutamyl-tRNA reductase [Deltaproteobacteria bacterium]